jgi:hypothetical protein
MATRFDVPGAAPLEVVFEVDRLAALHLVSLSSSEAARYDALLTELLLRAPEPDVRQFLSSGGSEAHLLLPGFDSLSMDVCSGWPLDMRGVTYTRSGRRLQGRSNGLGSGYSWRPRLLETLPPHIRGLAG